MLAYHNLELRDVRVGDILAGDSRFFGRKVLAVTRHNETVPTRISLKLSGSAGLVAVQTMMTEVLR
jgi:hypothetical protein